MAKPKKAAFSVTKAVKANARDRVGTPKAEAVLPDNKTKADRRASKHKVTLPRLLDEAEHSRATGK